MAFVLLLMAIVALALAWVNTRARSLSVANPSIEMRREENDPHSDANAQVGYKAKGK